MSIRSGGSLLRVNLGMAGPSSPFRAGPRTVASGRGSPVHSGRSCFTPGPDAPTRPNRGPGRCGGTGSASPWAWPTPCRRRPSSRRGPRWSGCAGRASWRTARAGSRRTWRPPAGRSSGAGRPPAARTFPHACAAYATALNTFPTASHRRRTRRRRRLPRPRPRGRRTARRVTGQGAAHHSDRALPLAAPPFECRGSTRTDRRRRRRKPLQR